MGAGLDDDAVADDGLAEDGVAERLGRTPQGAYDVVVTRSDGAPVVIRNAPLLDDGRPMPTRYWLVDPELRAAVGRLEAAGGVRRAEAEVDGIELAAAHDRYRRERQAALPADHDGPSPSGGVGGTRTGVKCLHAHYAWWLAGGNDPVGQWVQARLVEEGEARAAAPGGPERGAVAAVSGGMVGAIGAAVDVADAEVVAVDGSALTHAHSPASVRRRRIDVDSTPSDHRRQDGGRA